MRAKLLLVSLGMVFLVTTAFLATTPAADWSQWRGANRDAKATGFVAPATWPKELTKKWSVTLGEGDATPALVGDRLYVFSRLGDEETTTCLDAASGKVLWQDKYAAQAVQGAPARHPGPRSSPTVAEGKVCTLGATGVLSCLEAASGKVLWRKDDFKGVWPQFYTSSSPIVINGLCIAQLGGRNNGAIVAYDLTSGAERWKWTGDGPAYGSPVPVQVGKVQAVLAPTDANLVAIRAADGKVQWQVKYSQGRYNTATPIIDGDTLIYAGPAQGMTAERLAQQGDELTATPLWKNGDNSMNFNTPVLKDGLLYGISQANLVFCVRADNGQTAWSAPLSGQAGGQAAPPPAAAPPGKGGKAGRGGGGGFASVVDAGSVLVALSPAGQLVAFAPSATEFKPIASYTVAAGDTYAYPVLSGNRIFIKDKDAVTLWTID